MPLTITEALAEIKTIGKRVEAKRTFINGILWRPEAIRDPLAARPSGTTSSRRACAATR